VIAASAIGLFSPLDRLVNLYRGRGGGENTISGVCAHSVYVARVHTVGGEIYTSFTIGCGLHPLISDNGN